MSPQHRLLWDIFRPSGSRLHQMKCPNEIMRKKIKSFKRSELVLVFSPSFYTFGKRGLITSRSPVSLNDCSVRHFGWSTRRKSLLASARRCVFRVTCGACNRCKRLLIGTSRLYSTNLTIPDIIHISLCAQPCRFWKTLQAPSVPVGVVCSLW